MDPSDVNLEIRGEELRISGSFQERERGGVVRRQNRQTGEFEYTVDLPSDVDASRVEATYNNGVLTVSVGKRRDARSRRIEIQGKQSKQVRPGQAGQAGTTGQGGQSGQGDRR